VQKKPSVPIDCRRLVVYEKGAIRKERQTATQLDDRETAAECREQIAEGTYDAWRSDGPSGHSLAMLQVFRKIPELADRFVK